jgi:hypothetical protein
MPAGSLPLTALPSVMTPAFVTLAALPLISWVNQIVPPGPAAMAAGPVSATGEERHRIAVRRVDEADAVGRESDREPDLPICRGDGDGACCRGDDGSGDRAGDGVDAPDVRREVLVGLGVR